MLQPPLQQASQVSIEDFAIFFRDKVLSICSPTAAAAAQVINIRRASSLCSFTSANEVEIMTPLKKFALESMRPRPSPHLALETLITLQCTSYLSHLQYINEGQSFSISTQIG
jgi:hypothetical protein